MSEPIFEVDYEFHCTHGPAVMVTVREGRDTVLESPEHFTISVEQETGAHLLVIYREKLNGYSAYRREVKLEDEHPVTKDYGEQ